MQEPNQFHSVTRKLDPQAVITDPDTVIAGITFDFSDAVKFIQRVTHFQPLDELQKPFLYTRIAPAMVRRSFSKVLAYRSFTD